MWVGFVMRDYICSICNKVFTIPSHLILHLRIHTGYKPHLCPHCTSSFTSQSNLNQHVLKHTGERPYECKECGKTFLRSTHLKQHMQAEHLQAYTAQMQARAIENSKQCPVCKIFFSSKQKLKQHRKNIHPPAATSTTVHSQIEPVGVVTTVTQSVTAACTVSTITSSLGGAVTVTHHLPTATVTTATQSTAESRALNTPPPLNLINGITDELQSVPDHSLTGTEGETSDSYDISYFIPDDWLE